MATHRLLCSLYYFLPMPGTAPRRNTSIVHSLRGEFDLTHVITSTPNASAGDTRIHTISAWDYRKLLSFVTSDGHVSEDKKSSSIAQFFITLLNTFPINIIFGEGGGWYLWKAYRKGLHIIQKEKITHIYTSYRPFSDHVIGWLWKRKFPHLIWVADFRDLVVEPHYAPQFFPQWHHRICRWLFSRADVLTTISAGFIPDLKEYHPAVLAIMNGIDDGHRFPATRSVDRFTIVYTGSMFKNERNAEPLFSSLKRLIQGGHMDPSLVRVLYAGKDGYQWQTLARQYELEDIFEDRKVISASESRELQEMACVNVILTISSDRLQGVLTGKMIEYFAVGRPILCIVKKKNDPIIQGIMADIHAGLCTSDEDENGHDIDDFLLHHYRQWVKTQTNETVIDHEALMHTFSKKATIRPLIQFIHAV